ncbi:MAG: MJ1255/VC2487 family glycosyltransferase [Candidatus Woesearchaeota archaeon]
MVKILYAINGDGMGHATRSEAIIEELKKKHQILIIAGSTRVYNYLKIKYTNLKKYEGIRIVYKDNKVDDYTTLKNYIKWIAKESPSNIKKLYKIFKSFKPDILITDFEGTTAYIANALDIPTVCICNIHSVTKLKYTVPKKYRKTKTKVKIVINAIFPRVDYHLVTSFFYTPVKHKNVFVYPPILRKNILSLKPIKKDFILVYQTSDTNTKLLSELKEIKNDFVIYGFNKTGTEKNLTFRKFNNDIWLKDLSECKACIANGGYSFISEAVSLHKPVLSVPIKGQFEQILNALFIKKLGYGEIHDSLTKKRILGFIKNINTYEKNLKKFKKEDNSKILAKIGEIIAKECSS